MKQFKAHINRITYLGQDAEGFAAYTEVEFNETIHAETEAEAIKQLEKNDGITRTRVTAIKELRERQPEIMLILEDEDGVEPLTAGPLDHIRDYLTANAENLFGWQSDDYPELPDFASTTTLAEIDQILKERDYSWWTIRTEESEAVVNW